MSRNVGAETARRLLNAGRAIIAQEGATKLTLDAVVGRAGLSKGAVLHHFKTKSNLSRCLMQEAIDEFSRRVQEARKDDLTPGSYTRAYVRASMDHLSATNEADSLRVMSSLARDPACRELLAVAIAGSSQQIAEDGIDPLMAELVRLAVDGLWFHETAEFYPMPESTRSKLLAFMIKAASPTPCSHAEAEGATPVRAGPAAGPGTSG